MEALKGQVEPKGKICIRDVMLDPQAVAVDDTTFEITIKTNSKTIQLKAESLEDAVEWQENIEAWLSAVASQDEKTLQDMDD